MRLRLPYTTFIIESIAITLAVGVKVVTLSFCACAPSTYAGLGVRPLAPSWLLRLTNACI